MTGRKQESTSDNSRAKYEAPKVELLGDVKDLTQRMMVGTFADMASFDMAMHMS
jgi:hypothetical protein